MMAANLVLFKPDGSELLQDIAAIGKLIFVGKDLQLISHDGAILAQEPITEIRKIIISTTTALENVESAAQLCKDPIGAQEALEMVGLGDRADHFPAQLSGGEQQRVAIARALAKNPRLLLCDEPTGALDYETGKLVLKLLHRLSKERGTTVIIITHNQAIAPMAERIIRIQSGKILSNQVNNNIIPIELIEW